MRKYILPETGNFYKANLHCHSNISDGVKTPQELKELYKSRGYSVLAITDHNLLVPHHELDDDDFIMLTGYEINFNEMYTDYGKKPHFCAIAIDKDNETDPVWHSTKYIYKEERAKEHLVKKSGEDFCRQYSGYGITRAIEKLKENGFFVTYNHPSWSLQTIETFNEYYGMDAMEIFNTGCYTTGFHDYDVHCYEELLRKARRLYCICADDNHNEYPEDSNMCDSFGGYVVIKADKLDYNTLTKALCDGDFYSSTGPEIYDYYYEDDMVHITCSEAERIVLSTDRRYSKVACKNKGEFVTEATFEVPKTVGYFRVTVYGKDGKRAYTNATFIDEVRKF